MPWPGRLGGLLQEQGAVGGAGQVGVQSADASIGMGRGNHSRAQWIGRPQQALQRPCLARPARFEMEGEGNFTRVRVAPRSPYSSTGPAASTVRQKPVSQLAAQPWSRGRPRAAAVP